jgi:hypothetical protein
MLIGMYAIVRLLLNDSNSESKLVRTCTNQGLPDGIFSNQNRDLGNFRRVLQWMMLVYVYYRNLVYVAAI